MASIQVQSCMISLPVNSKSRADDPILHDLSPVPTRNNKILNAILDVLPSWDTSPIIWVDNCAYKISVVEVGAYYAVLLQMPLDMNYKPNGKEVYKVISKRTVKIVF